MNTFKNLMAAAALALPAILMISSPASASTVNLLTNGDFRAGIAVGWTLAGPFKFTGITRDSVGNIAFASGEVSAPEQLSQTVATTIGTTYTLSFNLSEAPGSDPSSSTFTAGLDLFGPSPRSLLSLNSTSTTNAFEPFNFTNYVLSFVATGSTTDISFALKNTVSEWLLDNVTLVADNVAATPLPGASILFSSGLSLIGFVAWRNKRGGFAGSIAG